MNTSFSSLELAVDEAEVGAAARLQRQPAVGPELPLCTKAVRRVHSPNQHGHANRTQPQWCAATWSPDAGDTQNQIVTGVATQLLQQGTNTGTVAGRGAATHSRLTSLTTLADAVLHKASGRHKQWPGCDRALSIAP